MKLSNPYHLPHNSIRVDEFDFMLKSIDLSRSYYSYNELRLLFLQKEIESNVFAIYHSAYHNNLENNCGVAVKRLYQLAKAGDVNAIENLLKPELKYTERKSFKQVWNETVRDYTEFFAFLGLLPTYYKGLGGGENRHYITSLLKGYVQKNTKLTDLLLAFKFRNGCKDYKNLDMYHVEVRPFVVAIEALKAYKSKGFDKVNTHIISAIVTYSKDEYQNFLNNISLFPNPTMSDEEYADNFEIYNESIKKEIRRATLLLKPYLQKFAGIDIVRHSNGDYYHITDDIYYITYPKQVAYCNGEIGDYKLTPIVGKVIYSCLNNYDKDIEFTELFDANFSDKDRGNLLNCLKSIGIIDSYDSYKVKVSSFDKQYALNPYTDFMSYSDARYVAEHNEMRLKDERIVIRDNSLQSEFETLRSSALGSNGTAYEENLYSFLCKNIHIFQPDTLHHFGAASTGKRLSDIAGIVPIYNNGSKKHILVIMECKAGNAIRSFDERKERDDIINTIKLYEKYDGVWYWVVDSDSIPDTDVHGGYRNNQLSKSFGEKLNDLQYEISEETRLPAIATAFSIDALTVYLSYLHQNTKMIDIKNGDSISETLVPHFWRWSKKFMNLQYVTIHKNMTL